MTLKFLLDTSVISASIAKEPNRKVIKRLDQNGFNCAIASPVWHELVYGCTRLPVGNRRAALQEYLQTVVLRSFPVLPYDKAAAEWHGRERARLEELGKTPPFVDGQIAAIAHTCGLTLVTTNTKHFALFEDLPLADWTR